MDRDDALILGLGGSYGIPGSPYKAVGSELLLSDDWDAIYSYQGDGAAFGGGGSGTIYWGKAFNVDKPEDYTGMSNSVTFTGSLGTVGVTASYF